VSTTIFYALGSYNMVRLFHVILRTLTFHIPSKWQSLHISQEHALLCTNCTVRYTKSALSPNRTYKHITFFISLQIHSLRLFPFSHESAHKYVIISIFLSRNHFLKPIALHSPWKPKQNSYNLAVTKSLIYITHKGVTSLFSDSRISIVLSSRYYVQCKCKCGVKEMAILRYWRKYGYNRFI